MPNYIPGTTIVELTETQYEAIDWFMENPPKYYAWFYRVYKKVLAPVLFLSMFSCMILAIIHTASNLDMFNAIKYIFFVACGFGLWALASHLFKVFYTKRYAKKIGLTLKEWDLVTIGQSWDI